MKIFVISDIHLNKNKLYKNVPSQIDYLIIAGDLCGYGNREEANDMLSFLTFFKKEKRIKEIIVIPGNHDISLMKSPEKYREKYPEIQIESLGIFDISGYKIFMSGYCSYCGPVWCNGYETIEEEKEVMVPKEPNVDIVITHGPPNHKALSMLKYAGGVNIGSDKLREYLEYNDVKYAFSGHAHAIDLVSEINETFIGETFCKNVSENGYLLELD